MEGDAYGDMMATYPAYWSGLKSRELVVLMDARVLGRGWSGQIMGQNPQVEEWAAAVAPDVGALQHLLSTLDDQRAVWSQVRVFAGEGAEASEGKETLIRTPLGGPGLRERATWRSSKVPARSRVQWGSRQHPTRQWHPCVWGKRSGALRAQVGRRTQSTGTR